MLYRVVATNKTGVEGTVELSNGKRVETSHPLNNHHGFNPEELIALAWSTCLNETLQTLFKARGITHRSVVDVQVELCREKDGIGYYFDVIAIVKIENMSREQSVLMAESAHQRCPVSKLIRGATTVSIKVEEYKE